MCKTWILFIQKEKVFFSSSTWYLYAKLAFTVKYVVRVLRITNPGKHHILGIVRLSDTSSAFARTEGFPYSICLEGSRCH